MGDRPRGLIDTGALLAILNHRDDWHQPCMEALSVLRYTTPGVILLDLNMPEFDGKQVLGFLQRSVEHCTIPVIVVTACEGDDCTEAIQKGAFTVLSKTGSSLKQLIDYIRHVTKNDDAAAA